MGRGRGCCQSTEVPHYGSSFDGGDENHRTRLLLLGCGESGKSTINKQVMMIFENGRSYYEGAFGRDIIVGNIFTLFRQVLEYMDGSASEFSCAKVAERAKKLFSTVDEYSTEDLSSDDRALLYRVFQDRGFMSALLSYRYSTTYPVRDDFVARAYDVLSDGYEPSSEDIVRMYIKTTGIIQQSYVSPEFGPFDFIDTGGQRSERKKWHHMFNDTPPVVMFVIRLDEYGQTLYESDDGDRLAESLQTIQSVVGGPMFKNAYRGVFVVLNGTDLLRRRITRTNDLKVYYPAYRGGRNYDAALDFIRNLVIEAVQEKNPGLGMRILTCSAVHRPDVERLVSDVLTEVRAHPNGLPEWEAHAHAVIPRPVADLSWKEARIFVSSTFLDQNGERNHLTQVVFPELRERCARNRIRFVEIDLRWGVTEDDAKSNRTLEICMGEVDRCRPFFIGLWGERYGWVPDKELHIPDIPSLDWIREYPDGRSVTEMEMYYAAMKDDETRAKNKAFFYLRDPAFLKHVPKEHIAKFVDQNEESKQRLREFKDRLIEEFPDKVFNNYPCKWGGVVDGVPTVTGLEEFGKRVTSDLWGAICEHFGIEKRDDRPVEIVEEEDETVAFEQREMERHRSFIGLKASRFVGRTELLAQFEAYITGGDDQDGSLPLVAVGKPGAGKSALLAKVCYDHMRKHPNDLLVPVFIGITPQSPQLIVLLRCLCRSLLDSLGSDDSLRTSVDDLRAQFYDLLERCGTQQRVIVVIDAVNQMTTDNRAHSMQWLPRKLPKGCKLIVSTLEGDTHDALVSRDPKPPLVLVGPLSEEEKREIVVRTLEHYRKKLDDRKNNDQLGLLTKKSDAASPLFLAVACEELRLFGVFERVTDFIGSLPEETQELMQTVFLRLERNEGEDLVREALSLVECARGGLPEDDLLRILRQKMEHLNRAEWARVYRALEFLLRPIDEAARNTLVDFFHRQVSKSVRDRYLGSEDTITALHRMLMRYFLSCARESCKGGSYLWKPNQPRPYRDVVYHALQCNDVKAVLSALCNVVFVEMKLSQGLGDELLRDYDLALARGSNELLHEYSSFVRANLQLLTRFPALSIQTALNVPTAESNLEQDAKTIWKEMEADLRPPVVLLQKSRSYAGSAMLGGGKMTDGEESIDISSTRFRGSSGIVASDDILRTVKVANENVVLGEAVRGFRDLITSVALCSNGTLLAAIQDGTVCVVRNGAIVATSRVSDSNVISMDVTDSGIVAFGLRSRKVVLTTVDELTRGETVTASNTEHQGPISAIAISRDGTRVVSGDFYQLSYSRDTYSSAIVYSVENNSLKQQGKLTYTQTVVTPQGPEHRTIQAHYNGVHALAWHPNGSQVASGGGDFVIRLWNTEDEIELLGVLNGHTRRITALEYSPSGKFIVSGSEDSTAIVWHSETLAALGTIAGSFGVMRGVGVSETNEGEPLHVFTASGSTVSVWSFARSRDANAPVSESAITAAASCGARVVYGTKDGSLYEQTMKQGKKSSVSGQKLLSGGEMVAGVVVSPDIALAVYSSGKAVVAGGAEGNFRARSSASTGGSRSVQDISAVLGIREGDGKLQQIIVGDMCGSVRSYSADLRQQWSVSDGHVSRSGVFSLCTDQDNHVYAGFGNGSVASVNESGFTWIAGMTYEAALAIAARHGVVARCGTAVEAYVDGSWAWSQVLGEPASPVFAAEITPRSNRLIVVTQSKDVFVFDPRTGTREASMAFAYPSLGELLSCASFNFEANKLYLSLGYGSGRAAWLRIVEREEPEIPSIYQA